MLIDCVCKCVSVCLCVYACVCACVRERERERVSDLHTNSPQAKDAHSAVSQLMSAQPQSSPRSPASAAVWHNV